jgi:hypothetical protein
MVRDAFLFCVCLSSITCHSESDDSGLAPTHPTDVQVVEQNGVLNIFSTFKNELRVWQVPAKSISDRWKLVQTWENFVYLWYGVNNGKDILVVTKSGGALYEVGKWDKAILSIAALPSSSINAVRYIYPSNSKDAFSGIAVRVGGGSDSTDPSRWMLFSSEDGKAWQRMSLEQSPSVITDFLRVGPGVVAIAGPDIDGDKLSNRYWHLFQRDDSGEWHVLQIPIVHSRITSIDTFAYPNGMSLSLEGADHVTGKQWLYNDGTHGWLEIHDVIPTIPPVVIDIKSDGHILDAITDESQVNEEKAPVRHYFVHDASGKWTSLSDELKITGKDIFALTTFGKDRRYIAFQLVDRSTGRHSADWTLEYLGDDGRWAPIQGLPSDSPKEIWDIRSFAQGSGLGVQSVRALSPSSPAFEWVWMLKMAEGWRPLQSIVSDAPKHIWNVHCEDMASGMAIEDEEASGLSQWKWFLPVIPGKWSEIADVVSMPPGFPDRGRSESVTLPENDDNNLKRNVIGIRNENGEANWFIKSGEKWLSVDDAMRAGLR